MATMMVMAMANRQQWRANGDDDERASGDSDK